MFPRLILALLAIVFVLFCLQRRPLFTFINRGRWGESSWRPVEGRKFVTSSATASGFPCWPRVINAAFLGRGTFAYEK